MSLTSYDMLCTNASVPPLLPIGVCVRMKAAVRRCQTLLCVNIMTDVSQLPKCEKWYTSNCVEVFDAMSCSAAAAFCAKEIAFPVSLTGTYHAS